MPSSDLVDRLALAAAAFAAGVGLGLLLAPQPGDQARRRIIAQARGAADAARAQAHDLADPLAERVRETGRQVARRHVPLTDDVDLIDAGVILDDLDYGRD